MSFCCQGSQTEDEYSSKGSDVGFVGCLLQSSVFSPYNEFKSALTFCSDLVTTRMGVLCQIICNTVDSRYLDLAYLELPLISK